MAKEKPDLDHYTLAADAIDKIDRMGKTTMARPEEIGLGDLLILAAINNLSRSMLAVADAIHNNTEKLESIDDEVTEIRKWGLDQERKER